MKLTKLGFTSSAFLQKRATSSTSRWPSLSIHCVRASGAETFLENGIEVFAPKHRVWVGQGPNLVDEAPISV